MEQVISYVNPPLIEDTLLTISSTRYHPGDLPRNHNLVDTRLA